MLEQVGTGNFTLGSIAGTNVEITANGNIVSRTDDIGYINASDMINLVSTGGGIGTTTEGLRIKNSGAVVIPMFKTLSTLKPYRTARLSLVLLSKSKAA